MVISVDPIGSTVERDPTDHTPLTPSPTHERSRSSSVSPSLAPQFPAQEPGSLPLTPPTSSGPHSASKATPDQSTTSSRQSHQEYLDSLQPPSEEEFQRLAKVQEQREKEHRRRSQELRRKSVAMTQQSTEARQDFVQTKAAEKEEQSGHRRSIF
ncbi:hypothetical protein K449DRAFT_348940, partial [Hypoxylon sp. EC38]